MTTLHEKMCKDQPSGATCQALHMYVLGTAIWSMNLLTRGVSVVMNAVNNNVKQATDTRKYSVYYQELSKEAKCQYNEKLDTQNGALAMHSSLLMRTA